MPIRNNRAFHSNQIGYTLLCNLTQARLKTEDVIRKILLNVRRYVDLFQN
jgi:hypothetical protein